MKFLGKKSFPSVPSVRSFFSYRNVTVILLFHILVVHLRHSQFLQSTDVGGSEDKESFIADGVNDSPSFESRFVGSVLSRKGAGDFDGVPEGSNRRSLFGSIVGLFTGGEKGDISTRGNGTEASEAGIWDDTLVQTTDGQRLQIHRVNKAGLLPDFKDEALQETSAEEVGILKWGEEGRPTDPPAEGTKDPLGGVLTQEDNQQLERIEGALEYEIFEADKAAERRAGVSEGEDPPSWEDASDPERRRALLQQKIDEQLAPYKKGGFTYADVAAQRNKTGMCVHFKIRNGTVTMVKDPEKVSEKWSYWYRADQVNQMFKLLIKQGRIPDHVEIAVNIEASPRLLRSERSPDLPPVLSYCSTAEHYDLIGVGFQYHRCLMRDEYKSDQCKLSWDPEKIRRDHPWEGRRGSALWRGSPTGGLYRVEDWKEKARSQLVMLSKANPELLDAMFTKCADGQCTQAAREAIGKELGYADRLANFTDYMERKYLVDIDGESWSSRFFQLLASGATIFKQSTHYREFSDFFFEAGTHYVRYAEDLGDLLTVLQGAEGRQEELRDMAVRSLALVEQLTKDDVILEYMGMLLTSYAELFAPEEGASAS
ncbi:protein glucosyltransferase [Klebsormidium nitens]|uniref:Protein glucosyltransferase n=1 Tax=Klebsormidium nitens TaxID=105231 RepID=A0A1Y1HNB9_KLENI|nr:protein glucosyltransferase [Klebsormidium nitens]|eukprot:GAQ78481.1 protein glucosyltransferase [Klebsormidium nitens]